MSIPYELGPGIRDALVGDDPEARRALRRTALSGFLSGALLGVLTWIAILV